VSHRGWAVVGTWLHVWREEIPASSEKRREKSLAYHSGTRQDRCPNAPPDRHAWGGNGERLVSQGENDATRRVSATLAACAWGMSTPAAPTAIEPENRGEEKDSSGPAWMGGRRIRCSVGDKYQSTLYPSLSALSPLRQGPGQRLLHARKYLVDRCCRQSIH
jgi:hypothetical protein